MKVFLIVFCVIAIAGCLILGIAYGATQSELNETTANLQTTQIKLNDVQGELATTQADLTATETKLATTKTELDGAQLDLKAAAANLKAAEDNLASVAAELDTTQTQLTQSNTERDNALQDNAAMTTEYTTLAKEINQKLGYNEDCELFITPDNVNVNIKAAQIAGMYSKADHWDDYMRLYKWVVNNIEYNYDTKSPYLPEKLDGEVQWAAEYWKTPEETLTDKMGDCEDMANLLSSLFLSYNKGDFAVWSIVIQNGNSGHVAVALPVVDDQLAIFDPAGNYYTGLYLGTIQSLPINQTLSQWLNHWAQDMPGARVTEVFSEDFYQKFDTTQAFINWAKAEFAD